MQDLGEQFIGLIETLGRQYPELLKKIIKTDIYIMDQSVRIDYMDIICNKILFRIRMGETPFPIHLEEGKKFIRTLKEESKKLIEEIVFACLQEPEVENIDFLSRNKILIIEIFVTKLKLLVGDKKLRYHSQKIIDFFETHSIRFKGDFGDSVYQFLSRNPSHCGDFFLLLQSMTKEENARLIKISELVPKISESIDEEESSSEEETEIPIIIETPQIPTPPKKSHKNVKNKKSEDSFHGWNIVLKNGLNESILENFTVIGLISLCKRLNIDDLPEKPSKKDYRNALIHYPYKDKEYFL